MDYKKRPITRNIAKSGEVLNWSGFSPFQIYLGLIGNRSQSASCHIATVACKLEKHPANMKLTEKQIEEIADNLDCGMRCFYNLKTGEIKTILNFDSWTSADEEPWEEESKEIDDNWDDYLEFEGFESHDSFKIMADFAESVDDTSLQDRLINALNRPKPFQNFKWQIDNSGEYRQQWFDFKKMRYIQWVKEQIDLKNFDINEYR